MCAHRAYILVILNNYFCCSGTLLTVTFEITVRYTAGTQPTDNNAAALAIQQGLESSLGATDFAAKYGLPQPTGVTVMVPPNRKLFCDITGSTGIFHIACCCMGLFHSE